MRTHARLGFICFLVLAVMAMSFAAAESGAIRTYLTFRITTRTQSAIVNVGEDLQIEVGVEGVTPTRYQWYFEGEPIQVNGNERVYNLVNAQNEDAGIYCMEAYSGDKLQVKVEVNVRVIDPTELPETGDGSVPVEAVFAVMVLSGAALFVLYRRKRIHA